MRRIILLALSMMLLCGGLSAKKLPQKAVGLQLYSIRELLGDAQKYQQNHETVFRQLKEMGITQVEAASYGDGKFYGVSPDQYRKDCLAAGLDPISSHTTRGLSADELKNHDFTAALQWWDQAIAAHKAAGCKYIVTPWGPVPSSLQEGKVWCDYFNEIGKRCNAAGLKYGYHTHSHEYQKVEGKPWIEFMMENVDPANMFWQMDVYWCVMAKESPVKWFKQFPGRFRLLHIKDKYEVGHSGMVGYDAIFGNAGLAGLENYILELEGTDGTISIMEGVKRSAEYVRGADFVKKSYSK
ncbi:MAG: sugar phosphate isomerase/epimerase [Bacteroidaceae bacterium]|nr:sugar phosphate isomerase/epimerase [Bacteroidaceae bacterium]